MCVCVKQRNRERERERERGMDKSSSGGNIQLEFVVFNWQAKLVLAQ